MTISYVLQTHFTLLIMFKPFFHSFPMVMVREAVSRAVSGPSTAPLQGRVGPVHECWYDLPLPHPPPPPPIVSTLPVAVKQT